MGRRGFLRSARAARRTEARSPPTVSDRPHYRFGSKCAPLARSPDVPVPQQQRSRECRDDCPLTGGIRRCHSRSALMVSIEPNRTRFPPIIWPFPTGSGRASRASRCRIARSSCAARWSCFPCVTTSSTTSSVDDARVSYRTRSVGTPLLPSHSNSMFLTSHSTAHRQADLVFMNVPDRSG